MGAATAGDGPVMVSPIDIQQALSGMDHQECGSPAAVSKAAFDWARSPARAGSDGPAR